MSITAQLPPKPAAKTFTADSDGYEQAATQTRGRNMLDELSSLTAALHRLKQVADAMTPYTVMDWNAMSAKDQAAAVADVRDLRLRVEALIGGES